MVSLNIPRLLNPTLYASLKNAFGRVKVMSMGTPMNYWVQTHDGRHKIVITEWGEAYKVCCPKCHDRRFRLIVNHRHGTVDGIENVSFGNKIKCFNENCDHSNFDDSYLKPYIRRHKPVVIDTGADRPIGELAVASSPGRCVKLTSMPSDSNVVQYVVNRGFDPKELEDNYSVCYCYDGAKDFPLMTDRLVIPVHYNSRTVGWQGRTVRDASPKYYTMPGFAKGRVLFNFDRAKHKSFVVVCEGVFDAMRVGDCGVAVLGSQITSKQAQILYYNWKQGALLIMFDPDDESAQARANTYVERCRKEGMFAGGAANIVLSQGKDAADMTREELWQEIYKQCEQQKIRTLL